MTNHLLNYQLRHKSYWSELIKMRTIQILYIEYNNWKKNFGPIKESSRKCLVLLPWENYYNNGGTEESAHDKLIKA